MSVKPTIELYAVIPTERYLKKFLNNKITVDPEYRLSNKDKFGSFVYVCLQNSKYKVELNEKKFNDRIKIVIPPFYEKLQKLEICDEGIHLINQFLKCWFYEDFIFFMKTIDMFSLRKDKCIKTFCSIYDIDIDIDIQYDTLQKQYYRYRENHGQPVAKYILEMIEDK